jgi:hypothetical protein
MSVFSVIRIVCWQHWTQLDVKALARDILYQTGLSPISLEREVKSKPGDSRKYVQVHKVRSFGQDLAFRSEGLIA